VASMHFAPSASTLPHSAQSGGFNHYLSEIGLALTVTISRLPVRGLYFMCSECSHGGHQECYRSYYLSRPLINLDGSSTAANSRTNTILESETRSGAPSVVSLGTDPEKSDDGSSVKTEKTLDTLVTDPSNRNSLELPGQDSRGSVDWPPRGHPCAAGCGHFCWASNERGISEVQ
jgi:hypothetical protein